MRLGPETQTVLASGLTAGVMDILGAFVSVLHRHITPLRVLQSVASGWLGARAFQAGYKAAALGLASHFMIALGAAAVFYIASRRLPFLLERPYLVGPCYGLAVYWFMQLVVLPLSAFPGKTLASLSSVLIGMIVHIICVGSPIVLITRWYSLTKKL